MKTSDLEGAQLDYWVGKANNTYVEFARLGNVITNKRDPDTQSCAYYPSTNWSQGGPIIERNRIELCVNIEGNWQALHAYAGRPTVVQYGPTLLIAAMRCFVTSKFGEEVAE